MNNVMRKTISLLICCTTLSRVLCAFKDQSITCPEITHRIGQRKAAPRITVASPASCLKTYALVVSREAVVEFKCSVALNEPTNIRITFECILDGTHRVETENATDATLMFKVDKAIHGGMCRCKLEYVRCKLWIADRRNILMDDVVPKGRSRTDCSNPSQNPEERTEEPEDSDNRVGMGIGVTLGVLVVGVVCFLLGFKLGLKKARNKFPASTSAPMAELSLYYEDIFERDDGSSVSPNYNHLDRLQDEEQGEYLHPRPQCPPPRENINVGIYEKESAYLYPQCSLPDQRTQENKDSGTYEKAGEYMYPTPPGARPQENGSDLDCKYSKAVIYDVIREDST